MSRGLRFGSLHFNGRRLAFAAAASTLLAAVAVGDSIPGSPDAPPSVPVLHELDSLPTVGRLPPAKESPVPDVQDDPGSLTRFRGQVGTSLFFRVTGNASAGSVYGSGVYTDDSTLAAAVVHEGLLKAGETGVVRVTILPGQPNYDAANRHGVTSYAYGSWHGSYRVSRAPRRFVAAVGDSSVSVPLEDPGNLTDLAGRIGDSLVVRVTGTTNGYVWGSDVYTSDSDLSTAAVHAGLVQPGQTALVRVTILPGRSDYGGTTRHGVVSRKYGSWGGSYHLAAVHDVQDSFADRRDDHQVRDDPGNLTVFHRSVDDTLLFRITGSTDGLVWGSGPYTSDSDLSTAAVHAGVLQPGETGVVKVTVQPVQFGFPGTERHGVTTREFLPWDGNYRIKRAAPGNDTTGGFTSGGITITR